MADRLSPEKRSELMSKVRGKDTTPEMRVRRLLHAMGIRYRLHDSKLPGKPDIVMKSRNKAIFVHGCFWHRHPGCKMATTPKSKIDFWTEKFDQNVRRDENARKALEDGGWEVLTVWECETKKPGLLENILRNFLEREPTPPPSRPV